MISRWVYVSAFCEHAARQHTTNEKERGKNDVY